MASGCDTATKMTPERIQALRSGGYTFIGRYLRHLTEEEVQLITKSGLYIVSIFEKNPTHREYFTAAQGKKDAAEAIKLAKQLGQTPGKPIYFTVDFDAKEEEVEGCINVYLQAVKVEFDSNIDNREKHYTLGLYGSGAVLVRFRNIFTYTWLAGASAWRGSKGYTGWSLKQHANGTVINCGSETFPIDKDESNGEGGGWRFPG